MRSLPTRIRFFLAKSGLFCHVRAARHAMLIATMHAEADGMVDAERGRHTPPFLLRGEPALRQAWRNGQHIAHCLRDCGHDNASTLLRPLQGDSHGRT